MIGVQLGPLASLHTGIHGTLLAHPPAGVRYLPTDAARLLVNARRPPYPFAWMPLAEAARFGPGDWIAHSFHLPVVGRRTWIVETGDLLYTLLCGDFAIFGAAEPGREVTRIGPDQAQVVRARAAHMLRAYSHASCLAVLIYTQHELQRIDEILDSLTPDPIVRGAVRDRLLLCRPAAPPPPPRVLDKWTDEAPFTVVFCGRSFGAKRGQLALQVFGELAQTFPDVRFVYVGAIPRAAEVSGAIEHHVRLSRPEVLDLFRRAHVLFHPARFESLGMVLLEAAASAMAILTATGPGMDHTREWFGPDEASLVDRSDGDERAEDDAFYSGLKSLLRDRARARALAEGAYAVATSGLVSAGRRDTTLLSVYDAAGRSSCGELSIADISGAGQYDVQELDGRALRELGSTAAQGSTNRYQGHWVSVEL